MRRPSLILVISSELGNGRALVEILNRERWETICASTVEEFEELFSTRQLALVFCERQLSDGTYRDVLRTIRARNTNLRLVVTSRLADWDEYLEVLEEGAFDLIASPCRPADVAWAILRAERERKKGEAIIGRDKADQGMSSPKSIRAEQIPIDGCAVDSEFRRKASTA